MTTIKRPIKKVCPVYFRREDLEHIGRFGFAPYYTKEELEAMGDAI